MLIDDPDLPDFATEIVVDTKKLLLGLVLTSLEEEFVFYCPHNDGEKIIQRMRTGLTRLRARVTDQGLTPEVFMLKVISCNENKHPVLLVLCDKVCLKRTRNKNTISREIFKAIQNLSLEQGVD